MLALSCPNTFPIVALQLWRRNDERIIVPLQQNRLSLWLIFHAQVLLLNVRQFTKDVEHVLEMLPRTEGDVVALRYHEGVRKNELSAFR